MTSAADSDGLHLLVGDSKTAYAWKTAAVLNEPGLPADTWIGNHCVIDHSHAAVAYAPRSFSNHQDMMLGGAFTAIVNLDDGTVTKLPFTASLAYFDPTCNPATRTAEFTAYRDNKTRLVTVDTDGHTVADAAATGQVTSPVPASDGVIAALGNQLVHIDRHGKAKNLAKTSRAPYDIHALAGGKIAFLDRTGNTTTYAKTYADGKLNTIATGELDDLALKQAGGGNVFLTGHTTGKTTAAGSGVEPLSVSADADISSQGHLAVNPVVSPAVQTGLDHIKDAGKNFTRTSGPAHERTQGHVSHALKITGVATATGKSTAQAVPEPAKAPGGSLSPALADSPSAKTAPAKPRAADATTIDHDPVDTDRWCSVPRNDIYEQALQPTPNQVEWAVDMAVRGDLHSQYLRQGDWRSQTGIATIDPQGMFPNPTLTGGGRIPAQIELGILAQESNLWQAESGSIPGQMGNPLASVAGFYGHKGANPSDYWKIDWTKSDCGYGVGQVTDGMRMAGHEKPGETALPANEQKAIALDYATNIAASLQILADKWNEVHQPDQKVTVNNDDPSKPENWFTAVWNYNLGFNAATPHSNNPWGLGWYNNPANPIYPPSRLAFMDTTLDSNANHDAAHPQDWPYEEKVMGWSAWSIDTGFSYATSGRQDWPGESGFSSAGFRPAWWNSDAERSAIKPPLDTFCNASNACDVANPPPCETQHIDGCDILHWWNQPTTTWKPDCATSCGHENIKYGTLINEPGRGYRLQHGTPVCGEAPQNALIVESEPAGVDTWSDCGKTKSDGSFQFTFYPDSTRYYQAKGDLHQIGGGYQGHFWYAHARDASHLGGANGRMTIVGTWQLNGPVAQKQAMVYVHIPDTGAQTHNAVYQINTAWGTTKVRVDQNHRNDQWYSLGAYRFNDNTPQVTLSNSNGTGTADEDIAWDAVAFVPGDYGISNDRPVDLTLPNVNDNSPDPNYLDQTPSDQITAPLGGVKGDNGVSNHPMTRDRSSGGVNKPQCGPAKDGRQVCTGPSVPELPKSLHVVSPKHTMTSRSATQGDNGTWCDNSTTDPRATRYIECEVKEVPAVYRVDGEVKAIAYLEFEREIDLDGASTFTEHLTVRPKSIPPGIAKISLAIHQHLCESPCKPVEADAAAWKGNPAWTPGDTHTASLTSSYLWDASTAGKEYIFNPDVQIDGEITPSDDTGVVQTIGYQWSLDNPTKLDQVRCDTIATSSAGCVFVNSAPTYTFNAGKYPQAAAHAWLIQDMAPNHPGLQSVHTPLYYMGNSSQRDTSRNRICPTGWAANNGDTSALNNSGDSLNCDEFPFASTYNSGGMAASEGGLNPAIPDDSTTGVPNGNACVQTYMTKVDGTMHLYNLNGYVPSWTEVCGRSAMSGVQNQGSMSTFGTFMRSMRLMSEDAYWLDTGLTAACDKTDANSTSVKCTMTAK